MKIVYNRFIPFGSYMAINLFGILFTKRKNLPTHVINHEKIHSAQMREMWYIPFYIWYVIEYLIVRLFHRKQGDAYMDISFEEEAFEHQFDEHYLEKRKKFAWRKYVRIRSSRKRFY